MMWCDEVNVMVVVARVEDVDEDEDEDDAAFVAQSIWSNEKKTNVQADMGGMLAVM
jgi:hypothetical protein